LNIVSLLLSRLLRLFGDGRATVYVAVVVVVVLLAQQQQQLLLETRRSQQQRSLKESESVGGWSENKYRTFYLCSASLVFKL